MAFFIEKNSSLSDVKEEHRWELLFSDKTRKEARERLSLSISQGNFLISELKKKGAIKMKEECLSLPRLFSSINKDTNSVSYEFKQG